MSSECLWPFAWDLGDLCFFVQLLSPMCSVESFLSFSRETEEQGSEPVSSPGSAVDELCDHELLV